MCVLVIFMTFLFVNNEGNQLSRAEYIWPIKLYHDVINGKLSIEKKKIDYLGGLKFARNFFVCFFG